MAPRTFVRPTVGKSSTDRCGAAQDSYVEAPGWTRRYHAENPEEKAFGCHAEVRLQDGTVIFDEFAITDAHPLGARPFPRPEYEHKFRTLAGGIVTVEEQDRFLAVVDRIETLEDLSELNILIAADILVQAPSWCVFSACCLQY